MADFIFGNLILDFIIIEITNYRSKSRENDKRNR